MPVLLGSLARIPMGMLTDRFGGRAIFSILMVAGGGSGVAGAAGGQLSRACWSSPSSSGWPARRSPIGVGFVSRWTPAERQGAALGVYGLGNIGQSAAVFLGPVLAARIGWQPVFRGVAVLLVVWGDRLRPAGAQCAGRRRRPKGIGAMLGVLRARAARLGALASSTS